MDPSGTQPTQDPPTQDQGPHPEQIQDGERLLLEDRVSPAVPLPSLENATQKLGWVAIDTVGAWESFLCRFSVLEEVPQQHKGAWAAAWGHMLARWDGAETEKERDRALIWLGFLPQALLRRPVRGGKGW